MGDYLSHPETTKHSDDGEAEGVSPTHVFFLLMSLDALWCLWDAGMAQDHGRHTHCATGIYQRHVSLRRI